VYRILQPGYPRYYPVYRFGSIGEVHKIKLSEQVRLLLVRIPVDYELNSTPGSCCVILHSFAFSGYPKRHQSPPGDRVCVVLSP
jgi:hypothetical protein